MNTVLIWVACFLAAYLVGAIPTGFLIARAKGVDIRRVGSGNIGATNVFRALGKGWGVTTLALDMLKGFVPVHFFPPLAASVSGIEAGRELALVCAAAAVAGHNWPVYLRFKGGKGVATSTGVLIAMAPKALAAGLVVWLIVFAARRYVSLASIFAAVTVCAASWFFYLKYGLLLPSAFTILAAGLIWRHRGNISRLLAGTENRIEWGRGSRNPERGSGNAEKNSE
jgi:glycerol-3-phosphate acyltransferase PlsY